MLVDHERLFWLVFDSEPSKFIASQLMLAGEAQFIEPNKLVVQCCITETNKDIVDPHENYDDAFRAVAYKAARVSGALNEAKKLEEFYVQEKSTVGCLPYVSCLLQPLKALVQQAYCIFLGCPWEITCDFHAWHLLSVDFHVDWVQRECFGNIALGECQR